MVHNFVFCALFTVQKYKFSRIYANIIVIFFEIFGRFLAESPTDITDWTDFLLLWSKKA